MTATKEVNLTQLLVDQRKATRHHNSNNKDKEEEDNIDESFFDTREELSADFFPLFSLAPPSRSHSRAHSTHNEEEDTAHTPAEEEQQHSEDAIVKESGSIDIINRTPVPRRHEESDEDGSRSDSLSHSRAASRSCSQRHMRTQGQHRVQPTPYKVRPCEEEEEEEEEEDGVEWHVIDVDDNEEEQGEVVQDDNVKLHEAGDTGDATSVKEPAEAAEELPSQQPIAIKAVAEEDQEDGSAKPQASPSALPAQTVRDAATRIRNELHPPWLSVQETQRLYEGFTRNGLHSERYGRFLQAYLGLPQSELARACRRAKAMSAIGIRKVKSTGHGVLVKTTRSFRRHSVLAVEGDAVFNDLITRAELREVKLRTEMLQQLQADMPPFVHAQLMQQQQGTHTTNSICSAMTCNAVPTNARCIVLHYGLPPKADRAHRFPRASLIAVVCATRLEEGTEVQVSLESYYRCLDEATWYARTQAQPALSLQHAQEQQQVKEMKEEVAKVCWGVREFARWPHGLPYYHGVGHHHASPLAQAGFPFTLVDLVPTPELGQNEKGLATTHTVPYATCFLYGGPAVTTAQIERVLAAQQREKEQGNTNARKERNMTTTSGHDRTSTTFRAKRRGPCRGTRRQQQQPQQSKKHKATVAAEKEMQDMSFVLDDTYALGLGEHEVCYGQGLARYINHRYNLSAFGNCELCSLMLYVPRITKCKPQPSSPASTSSVPSCSTTSASSGTYTSYSTYRSSGKASKGYKNNRKEAEMYVGGKGTRQENTDTNNNMLLQQQQQGSRLPGHLATRQVCKRGRAKRASTTNINSHVTDFVHSTRMQEGMTDSSTNDGRRPAAVAALRSFQAQQQHNHHRHHDDEESAVQDVAASHVAVTNNTREDRLRALRLTAKRYRGKGRTTATASLSLTSSIDNAKNLEEGNTVVSTEYVLITLPFFITTTDIPAGVAMLAWTYGEEYDAKLERMVVADGQLVPAHDAAVLNASRPLLLSSAVPHAATCWVRYRTAQEVHRASYVRRWQRYQGDYRFAIAVGDVVWRRRPYCVAHAPYIDYATQDGPLIPCANNANISANNTSTCSGKHQEEEMNGAPVWLAYDPTLASIPRCVTAKMAIRVLCPAPEEDLFVVVAVMRHQTERVLLRPVRWLALDERTMREVVRDNGLDSNNSTTAIEPGQLDGCGCMNDTAMPSAAICEYGQDLQEANQSTTLALCSAESETMADRMLGKRICAARRSERAACLAPRWAVCELADPGPYHRFHRSAAAANKTKPQSPSARTATTSLSAANSRKSALKQTKKAAVIEPDTEWLLRGCVVATTDSVALLQSGTDYHHVSLDCVTWQEGWASNSKGSFIAVDREALRRQTRLVRQSTEMAHVPPLCSGLLWPLFCAQPAPTLAALTLAPTPPSAL